MEISHSEIISDSFPPAEMLTSSVEFLSFKVEPLRLRIVAQTIVKYPLIANKTSGNAEGSVREYESFLFLFVIFWHFPVTSSSSNCPRLKHSSKKAPQPPTSTQEK